MITLSDYQRLSAATDSPKSIVNGSKLLYYALGLVDESGEVFGKIKKLYRDYGGVVTDEWREGLKLELGDVLWYSSQIMTYFEVDIISFPQRPTGVGVFGLLSAIGDEAFSVFKIAQKQGLYQLEIIDSVYWLIEYVADFADCYGLSIEVIAQANLDKLADRQARGAIQGEGDNR